MVARSDIDQINELNGEDLNITRTLRYIDAGGRIVNMTIAVADTGSVSISTGDMYYPPQMMDMIKAQLTARQTALRNDLIRLGITNLDQTGPDEP